MDQVQCGSAGWVLKTHMPKAVFAVVTSAPELQQTNVGLYSQLRTQTDTLTFFPIVVARSTQCSS